MFALDPMFARASSHSGTARYTTKGLPTCTADRTSSGGSSAELVTAAPGSQTLRFVGRRERYAQEAGGDSMRGTVYGDELTALGPVQLGEAKI